jgi:nucleotide-binding universal stress UspA family protein
LAHLSRAELNSVASEARQRLDEEWCAPLRDLDVSYRAILEHADARQTIVQIADAIHPAAVVESRGLGALTQRLLGSITHYLVLRLNWPAMIIPSPHDRIVRGG